MSAPEITGVNAGSAFVEKRKEDAVDLSTCKMVNFVSKDGVKFAVPRPVAQMSVTIKEMLEDLEESEQEIPLPEVTAAYFEKVIAYCERHHYYPEVSTDPNWTPESKRSDDIVPWDANFINLPQEDIFQIILAANYLNIKNLLDLGCKTVANMIKGKTPEEIRKLFNIKNDFTPEEEEQIRRENAWCEER
jgi:S-phase kinase-associated protein 1